MTRRNTFAMVWLATSLVAGGLVVLGRSANSPLAVTILIALTFYCAVALIGWLPKPSLNHLAATPSVRKGVFVVATIIVLAVFLFAAALNIVQILVALLTVGLVVLVSFHRQVTKREILYALGLGAIAGVAGLFAGINFISPTLWAMLQLALVVIGLLAGWSMLRYSGLLEAGIGRSRFLTAGAFSALSGFVQGVVLGIPWALSATALGFGASRTWVQVWWQPITALQPAIAEEAWGRILLVPLAFLILCRIARAQVALTVAIIIVSYWFAYLHASSTFDIFSTLVLGTLVVLPLSYLCLYRDLETAIGFHFVFDFAPALIAALLIQR